MLEFADTTYSRTLCPHFLVIHMQTVQFHFNSLSNLFQNTAPPSTLTTFVIMYIHSKQTSSTFLLGMWKNDSNNFSLTCVWRSGKQSLIFLSTSALSCEQMEPPVHESFDVPSLLCSHNDVSLSLTFAILNGMLWYCSDRARTCCRRGRNQTLHAI